MDVSNNPENAARRLYELIDTGFISPFKTRVVRVKMFFYSNTLAILCSMSVSAYLSPTGVLTTEARASSFPVQEYMPADIVRKLVIEGLLVLWTLGHLLKEVQEVYSEVCENASILGYFRDPYNILDWTRFIFLGLALAVRIQLLNDTSRDFHLAGANGYVDTENVQILYSQFDLLSAAVTIISLLSTVQYFGLFKRTNVLKETFSKTLEAMTTFIPVFMLFFGIYTLVGMYLMGPSLELYKDFATAFHTSFDMMNANIPIADILPAARGETLLVLVLALYYYSFVILHFIILFNVIIAIVVEAYMEVQGNQNSELTLIYRNNLGSLWEDVCCSWYRRYYSIALACGHCLNPRRLVQKSEDLFIPWEDGTWLAVLEEVLEARRRQGIPSRSCTLLTLSGEVSKLPNKGPRTIAERISGGDHKAMVARQVRAHFYERPWWRNPPNLDDPFSEAAQPASDSWADKTLAAIAAKAENLERKFVGVNKSAMPLVKDNLEALKEAFAAVRERGRR